MQLIEQPVGRSVEDLALRSMQSAGFRPVEGGRRTINGLDALVGTSRGTMQDLGAVIARAAHIVHGQNVFFVAGLAPQQIYPREEPSVSATIASFRPLPAAEAENIRPNPDRSLHRSPGRHLALDRGAIRRHVKATTLAIMNGRETADEPRPGERLKIVVGG